MLSGGGGERGGGRPQLLICTVLQCSALVHEQVRMNDVFNNLTKKLSILFIVFINRFHVVTFTFILNSILLLFLNFIVFHCFYCADCSV